MPTLFICMLVDCARLRLIIECTSLQFPFHLAFPLASESEILPISMKLSQAAK